MDLVLIRLVCKRGLDTFGLSLLAKNTRHALNKAKMLLEGSGYSVYPYKDTDEKRSA